jgi:hypothetical protein
VCKNPVTQLAVGASQLGDSATQPVDRAAAQESRL